MVNSSRRKSPSLAVRLAIWGLPLLFILLVAGFLVGRAWFNAYLESPAFRKLIGDLTSSQLKARGEYTPFHFSGAGIYSDAFKAGGTPQAFFSSLSADQIRAEINLGGLWNHAWELDEIDIQRVEVSLGHTASAPSADVTDLQTESTAQQPPASPAMHFDWLPKRVDLRKVVIREADLKWGENTPTQGSVKNAPVTLTPDGDAWNILCEGGVVSQAGMPDFTVDQARLRYQKPSLFITNSQLRCDAGGSVAVTAEVNFEKGIDAQAKLSGVSVTPFLREDWRAKLKGNLSGDLKIRAPLPLIGAPALEGSLTLNQGQLEALPVLDQIATFTRTQQFRQFSLTRVSGDFTSVAGTTTVTKFVAESAGLIRVEGGFVIQNSLIDGTFQVGITPSSLQWLPGSQEKVFTASHDGYVWTTVRLTGPLNSP
ncbi:MAG: hypothetical protein WCD79_16795, partial [Chthoniobacteraceae bacterium]